MGPVGSVDLGGRWSSCGWNEIDLLEPCWCLLLSGRMLLRCVWLSGLPGVGGDLSTMWIDELALHEGCSDGDELTTDLHWVVIAPMTTSLQDCQGRVGAYCLVRGLNHWPNLSAFLLLPPLWSPLVAPSTHGWP